MNHAPPLVLSIRSLHKTRLQGPDAIYRLEVPGLDVHLGEKVLITGPSGSGKSTILDLIGLVLKPDAADFFNFDPDAHLTSGDAQAPPPESGRLTALDRLRSSATAKDIALAWCKGHVEKLAIWRRTIGYVLQTGGLLPFITVSDNILLSRQLRDLPYEPLPEKIATDLGIRHLLHKLPTQLSVGERQRAAIARALAAKPSLVLADEPTAALDPANASTVLDLFCQMTDDLGMSLILVSHAPGNLSNRGFRTMDVELHELGGTGERAGTRAVLREVIDHAHGRNPPHPPSPQPTPLEIPQVDSPVTGCGDL